MKNSTSKGEIRCEIQGLTGYLLISNPRKRNAMTMTMWEALSAGIAALDADPDVRVIVVKGEGEVAFISSADIAHFEGERNSLEDHLHYDAVAEKAYTAPGSARGVAERATRKALVIASTSPAVCHWSPVPPAVRPASNSHRHHRARRTAPSGRQ